MLKTCLYAKNVIIKSRLPVDKCVNDPLDPGLPEPLFAATACWAAAAAAAAAALLLRNESEAVGDARMIALANSRSENGEEAAWRFLLLRRARNRLHKTGVINDPLGQTHSHVSSEHCFLLFCFSRFEKWGRTDGQQWSLPAVTLGWPSGSIFNMNIVISLQI